VFRVFCRGCLGNCINSPARNAERLNFCTSLTLPTRSCTMLTNTQVHHVVVPNMCSLDGSTTPPSFVENIVPWILSNMAIFMACCTQSAESGLQPHVSSETLSIKTSVLPHMNKRLEDEFSVVAVEILPAVMHLVLVEVSFFSIFPTFESHLTRMLSGGGETQTASGPTCKEHSKCSHCLVGSTP
jgi:hypothetical protein